MNTLRKAGLCLFLCLSLLGTTLAQPATAAPPVQPEGLRPVVMVHGFGATWETWKTYLGPDGYLAGIGRQGFAVGDGQVPGAMNTGSLTAPDRRTNTIAENAAILGEYIAGVKAATGASQVDLVAHSMGGLISRYYIGRVMQKRDVAQLIMLGSPMAGTECANLPAALGLYLPATLEIRPSYVTDIFNPQVTLRHGVPFYALAGIPIDVAAGSPCTPVPSDIAVARVSVDAIPVHVTEMPVLHTDMNISRQVFDSYVRPLIERASDEIESEPDPPPASNELVAPTDISFTRIFTGHVEAGGSSLEMAIPIDPNVQVASFGLFDPTHSLTTTVIGASGNAVDLNTAATGRVVIDDPSSLVHLGYGFENPRAGNWRVTVHATPRTPPEGADFALTARLQGGARLDAYTTPLLPLPGETTVVYAALEAEGVNIITDRAEVLLRKPDGQTQRLPMEFAGDIDAYGLAWTPETSGLYAIDVQLSGHLPDGTLVERSAFLSVQAQPAPDGAESGGLSLSTLLLGGIGAGLCLGAPVLAMALGIAWRRKRAAQQR